MTDVNRRQFLAATVAALAGSAFSDTALGSDAAFEQRGPRFGSPSAGGHWSAQTEEHLREEMRCWVGGIKDQHDLVIDHVKELGRLRHAKTEVAQRPSDEELRREIDSWASDESVEERLRHEEMRCWVANDFHGGPYVVRTRDDVRAMLERTQPTLDDLRRRAQEKAERLRQCREKAERFIFAREDAGSLYLDEGGDLCVS